jgi:hypothetical protein
MLCQSRGTCIPAWTSAANKQFAGRLKVACAACFKSACFNTLAAIESSEIYVTNADAHGFALASQGQFLLALLSLAPVVMATFVAVTRIYDHKHAPADVNAGW